MEHLAQLLQCYHDSAEPAAFLKAIMQVVPGKAVFTTSLGAEDQVITHLIARHQLPVHLATLDTGRLFDETYQLLQRTETRYKLRIAVYYPDTSALETLVSTQGINGFYDSVDNRKRCCHVRKVQPLQRALAGAQVWITGLRKEQSENRSDLPPVEWDASHGLYKVHPLLDWTDAQLWAYIKAEHIPYNPLHDNGYPSIGCAPCTRAVLPGEPTRAGRWWWEQSAQECGLHAVRNQEK